HFAPRLAQHPERAVETDELRVGRFLAMRRTIVAFRYRVVVDARRLLHRGPLAEGRSRAKAQGPRPKAQGKHMGRPPSLTPAQQKEAIRRRARGATLDELARSYNVSRATISRLAAGPAPSGPKTTRC